MVYSIEQTVAIFKLIPVIEIGRRLTKENEKNYNKCENESESKKNRSLIGR